MRFCKALFVALCITLFLGVAAFGLSADFTQRYRATLDFNEQPKGYEWTTGPEDVWRLKEFEYTLANTFRVKLGPSQVVFGTSRVQRGLGGGHSG